MCHCNREPNNVQVHLQKRPNTKEKFSTDIIRISVEF